MNMKTLTISIIAFIGVSIFGFGIACAQYGQEAGNPEHERALQHELDLFRIQHEKQLAEEKKTNDLNNTIILAVVGIPIAIGISVGMLLFTRKRK